MIRCYLPEIQFGKSTWISFDGEKGTRNFRDRTGTSANGVISVFVRPLSECQSKIDELKTYVGSREEEYFGYTESPDLQSHIDVEIGVTEAQLELMLRSISIYGANKSQFRFEFNVSADTTGLDGVTHHLLSEMLVIISHYDGCD